MKGSCILKSRKKARAFVSVFLAALLFCGTAFSALGAEQQESLASYSLGQDVSLSKEDDGQYTLYPQGLKGASEQEALPEGSYGLQLNSRQREFYDFLTSLSLERVLSAAIDKGYYTLGTTPSSVVGIRLTGSFQDKNQFEPDAASKKTERQLYTDLQAALAAYRFDHPEVFWDTTMQYGYRWSRVNSTTVKITAITYGFKMVYDGKEKSMASQQEQAIEAMLQQIPASADTYTKVKAIHDLLAEGNQYGDGTLIDDPESLSHQAFSALVLEDSLLPVCDGYAKAFKILCDQLSLPCVLQVSEKHMWNAVKMDDGEWYNLDLTWDDGEEISYDYFLVGSKTEIDGTAFSSQTDHIERNIYRAGENTDTVTFSYPIKNSKAYVYIGGDYPPLTFPDVPRRAWYYQAVEQAHQLGLFNGDTQGMFNPAKSITRAEFAQVMANAAGVDLTAYEGVSPFDDVDAGAWYAPAVAWAKEQGVVSGYTDNTFQPKKSITRQEMCVILWNAAQNPQPENNDLSFLDANQLASWALDAVSYCTEKGLILGDEKNNLNPQNLTKRCEAAVVFVRQAELS